MIHFVVIFPVQLSKFKKSVYFGSNLKKTARKNLKIFIFHIKINFYSWKNIFSMWNRVYSDRSELDLSDETIRIQKFHFSRKLWWKNCWKLTKLLPCGNAHSFQTYKDIDSKFWYHKLERLIKIVLKFQVLISYTFRKNKPSMSITVHLGRAGSSF